MTLAHTLRGLAAAGLATAGLVLGVPAVLPLGTSAAADSGRCDPGTGVTVVVDFAGLGGGVPIGCDPSGGGEPASQVVPRAGFSVTYVNGQPFVCRIEGKPSADQESCQRTPPADAYWGLFWSDGESGTWTYASQGIASLKVPEGGSIGFRWQDGGGREQPGAAPTRAAEADPKPTPAPTPSAKPTIRPDGTKPPGGSAPAPDTKSSSPDSSTPAATPAAAEPTPGETPPRRERKPRPEASAEAPVTVSPDATPSPALAEGGLADANEVAATDSRDGDGSGLTWVAAVVVLTLGAAVVVAARRRRA